MMMASEHQTSTHKRKLIVVYILERNSEHQDQVLFVLLLMYLDGDERVCVCVDVKIRGIEW